MDTEAKGLDLNEVTMQMAAFVARPSDGNEMPLARALLSALQEARFASFRNADAAVPTEIVTTAKVFLARCAASEHEQVAVLREVGRESALDAVLAALRQLRNADVFVEHELAAARLAVQRTVSILGSW